MALTPDELDRVAARTLAHYDEQALSYWNGTRDHDVSQNVDALLRHIEAAPPFELLDFGCGPGARPQDLQGARAPRHRPGGLSESGRVGANEQRMHGPGADFPDAGSATRALRRRLRQCGAVPRAQPGVAAGSWRTARGPEAWRCALQLEPARSRAGRLERRPVRCVSRLGGLARACDCGGIHRAGPLLSSDGIAARTAALARERVAQAGVLMTARPGARTCAPVGAPRARS
jgi:hypothetical protein